MHALLNTKIYTYNKEVATDEPGGNRNRSINIKAGL